MWRPVNARAFWYSGMGSFLEWTRRRSILQSVRLISSAIRQSHAPRGFLRRRRFTADFKKRVALEALRGDRTVQAIAAKHEVHPNQVGTWKRQAVEGLDEVFARGGSPGPSEHEATIRDLHAKVGELTMERDFFQRGLQR